MVNGVCRTVFFGRRPTRPKIRSMSATTSTSLWWRKRRTAEITKDGHPRSTETTETVMVCPTIYRSSISGVEVCPIYKQWMPHPKETHVLVGQWKWCPIIYFVINWTWEIRVKTAMVSGQTLVKKPFEDPREDHPLIVAVNPLMVELVWRPHHFLLVRPKRKNETFDF